SLSADDTSPSRHLMRQERHERLKTALASLSRRDRGVRVMRHLEQLGTAEIAAMLSIGEAAAKARLFCALMRMRDRMGGPEGASATRPPAAPDDAVRHSPRGPAHR